MLATACLPLREKLQREANRTWEVALNSDVDRWRLPAAYLDAAGHDDPDFAWELVRRSADFRRAVEPVRDTDRFGDALASWGLTFRPGPRHARRTGRAGLLEAGAAGRSCPA